MADDQKIDDVEIDVTLPPEGEGGSLGRETSALAPEGEAAVEPVEISAEEGIERFKAQLDEAKREKLALEARARAAEDQLAQRQQEIAQHRTQDVDYQISAVKSAREATVAKVTQLRQARRQAYADGNFEEVDKLDDTIVDHKVYVSQLDQGVRNLEFQKQQRQAPPRAASEASQQPAPALSWEDSVAQMQDSKSKSWIMAHQGDLKDHTSRQRMLAGHHDAIAKGVAAESPEYFEHVEKFMGLKNDAAPEPARKQQVAAPPSRTAPSGGTPTKVRLSNDERDMARSLGMSDETYARNKLALIREGKLTVEQGALIMSDEIRRGPGRPPNAERADIRPPLRSEPRRRTVGVDEMHNQFHVPVEMCPDGVSLQWVTKSVFGKEDPYRMSVFKRNGWQEATGAMIPGMMFEGGNPNAPIERDGLVLMERPVELTLEAEAELRRIAKSKLHDAKVMAGLTPPGHIQRQSSIKTEYLSPEQGMEIAD